MRWLALVVTVLVTACGSTPAPTPAPAPSEAAPVASPSGPSLGGLLVELEENLKREAVHASWTSRRADWRSEARAATARRVAALLTELERHLRWSVASPGWKARRGDWIEELGAVTNDWGAAVCLGELEASLDRAAVSDRWRLRRPRWIDDLRRAVGLRPAPLLERHRRTEQRGALWVLRNKTGKSLTVRWSGPMEGLRKLKPNDEYAVALIPGSYVVNAKAPDAEPKVLVREFETGFRYTETFGVDGKTPPKR